MTLITAAVIGFAVALFELPQCSHCSPSNTLTSFSANRPNLQHLVDHKGLRWIFVGGKGGVGKTTVSSSLAVHLSAHRESVLIISTDPAHNLGDAFGQKFGKDPSPVKHFDNLYAMEVTPVAREGKTGLLDDLVSSIPGIDEALAFAEVLKLVEGMKYSVIVLDTAPTGHTLRLLQIPSIIQKGIGHLLDFSNKQGGMASMLAGMMGGSAGATGLTGMLANLHKAQKSISNLLAQFRDPECATFVCVCIADALSVFETESLVQTLAKFEMDASNIVVNQVVHSDGSCTFCTGRAAHQKEYLNQLDELYGDEFHLVKLPLLTTETRGAAFLRSFGRRLMQQPDEAPPSTNTDRIEAPPQQGSATGQPPRFQRPS